MINLLFPDTGARYVTCVDGQSFEVTREDDHFAVRDLNNRKQLCHVSLRPSGHSGELDLLELDAQCDSVHVFLALFEAIFSFDSQLESFGLASAAFPDLVDLGIAYPGSGQSLQIDAGLLWQYPLWLGGKPKYPNPLHYVLTQERKHPRRPAKPKGLVYQRYIPWLQATLSFRAFEPNRDFDCFHRWMNDPFVAEIWDEAGDEAKHRAYLDALSADPHMIPLIASIDGKPFAYFEVYFAKENRLAPFYDALDYDRGWHVLVGEPDFRGKSYVTAWLPSIAHYMFLDDPRTQRIVGEPRADHVRQIKNLQHCGYKKMKEFDFPHKRAALVMLTRERFFTERLWIPRSA